MEYFLDILIYFAYFAVIIFFVSTIVRYCSFGKKIKKSFPLIPADTFLYINRQVKIDILEYAEPKIKLEVIEKPVLVYTSTPAILNKEQAQKLINTLQDALNSI